MNYQSLEKKYVRYLLSKFLLPSACCSQWRLRVVTGASEFFTLLFSFLYPVCTCMYIFMWGGICVCVCVALTQLFLFLSLLLSIFTIC